MVQLCLEIFEPCKIVGIGLFQFLDGIHLDQHHLTCAFLAATLFLSHISLIGEVIMILVINRNVGRFCDTVLRVLDPAWA